MTIETSKRARERKDDMQSVTGLMHGVIALVAHETRSHADMRDLTVSRVFSSPAYRRLTAANQRYLLGMWQGAVAAWEACGAIVWTHEVGGEIFTREQWQATGRPYSEIDSDRSSFRWASNLKVW
jgi:fructose-1,6-bisphosphatase/inositol monophosphatase family enzyme